MNRRSIVMVLGVAATVVAANPPSHAQEQRVADDAAIRAILAQRIDNERKNVGIVVGVIEPSGQRVIAHGAYAVNDTRAVDANTVFEIGSITKVFTSLLLADMAERGEVKLDDTVSKYLPPTVRVPEKDGRAITLQDLSTHTSGLPRLPANLVVTNIDNPYADYSVAQLYEFLSGYTLTRAAGSQFEYSNLGAGALGHALALRAGTDYETAVRARILAPLKMTDTAITLTPELRSRLARGHNQRREPAGNWDLPALAGAGALRSTARDMLRFLDAFVSAQPHALSAAAARMRSVDHPSLPGGSIALGWQIVRRPDLEIVSAVRAAIQSTASRGVRGGPARVLRHDRGRTVHVRGRRVGPRHVNDPARRFELFAEAADRFFAEVGGIEIAFDREPGGRVVSFTIRQRGTAFQLKRVE